MAKDRKSNSRQVRISKDKFERILSQRNSRSVRVINKGVDSSKDLAELLIALTTDVLEGRQSPAVTNAATRPIQSLLKLVELNHKFGTIDPRAGFKKLELLDILPTEQDDEPAKAN